MKPRSKFGAAGLSRLEILDAWSQWTVQPFAAGNALEGAVVSDVDGPSLATTVRHGDGTQKPSACASRAHLAIVASLLILVLANWASVAWNTGGLVLIATSWTWIANDRSARSLEWSTLTWLANECGPSGSRVGWVELFHLTCLNASNGCNLSCRKLVFCSYETSLWFLPWPSSSRDEKKPGKRLRVAEPSKRLVSCRPCSMSIAFQCILRYSSSLTICPSSIAKSIHPFYSFGISFPPEGQALQDIAEPSPSRFVKNCCVCSWGGQCHIGPHWPTAVEFSRAVYQHNSELAQNTLGSSWFFK